MWYPDYQDKKTEFAHAQLFQGFSFRHQISPFVLDTDNVKIML